MTKPEQSSADDPLDPVPDDVPTEDGEASSDEPSGAGHGASVASGAVPGPSGHETAAAVGIEELIADLERTSRERDELLNSLRRTQADFENYRKRVMKQQADDAARAAGALVEKLLPVLDACDGAVRHGATEVEPVFAALLGTLERDGLERIDPLGEAFDPNIHEAVMHEPAEDGDTSTVVSDVMRPGYAWKGRVVRPAMVKVRG